MLFYIASYSLFVFASWPGKIALIKHNDYLPQTRGGQIQYFLNMRKECSYIDSHQIQNLCCLKVHSGFHKLFFHLSFQYSYASVGRSVINNLRLRISVFQPVTSPIGCGG